MSGRDLRAFLASHRSGTFHTAKNKDSLHQKYCVGSAPKVAPVDYDHLYSELQQHKDKLHHGLTRFQQLSKRGRQRKQVSLLKKHHEIWSKEREKLASMKSDILLEINQWRTKNLMSDYEAFNEVISELILHETELYNDRLKFEELTLDPVWALRTDIKNLVEKKESLKTESASIEQIRNELDSAKQAQAKIQSLLEEECEQVQDEVEQFMDTLGLPLPASVDVKATVAKGVPLEVECLECHDELYRKKALSEFNKLDEHYCSRLERLREDTLSITSSRYGGWARSDAERFSCLVEQYPTSLANRRALYIDRAIREFPHKTRQEIVGHERWYFEVKHVLSVARLLNNSWARSKKELADKMAALFEEANAVCQSQSILDSEREDWRQKCHRLFLRVQLWREEKLKQQQSEAEDLARQQALNQEQRVLEEQKITEERRQKKQKINRYHTELRIQHQKEKEQQEKVKKQAEIEKRRQAVENTGRVDYRRGKYSEKLAEAEEARVMAAWEKAEREKRLELLRQQVAVDAEADPSRVQQHTVASNARQSALTDHSPLFTVHSYKSEAITSDPRVRLEAALREAGLHHTDYARRAMSRIPPPTKPRPDQHSSLFKD